MTNDELRSKLKSMHITWKMSLIFIWFSSSNFFFTLVSIYFDFFSLFITPNNKIMIEWISHCRFRTILYGVSLWCPLDIEVKNQKIYFRWNNFFRLSKYHTPARCFIIEYINKKIEFIRCIVWFILDAVLWPTLSIFCKKFRFTLVLRKN